MPILLDTLLPRNISPREHTTAITRIILGHIAISRTYAVPQDKVVAGDITPQFGEFGTAIVTPPRLLSVYHC